MVVVGVGKNQDVLNEHEIPSPMARSLISADLSNFQSRALRLPIRTFVGWKL